MKPKIQELDYSEAKFLAQQIHDHWGCQVTMEYAQSLANFIDEVLAEIASRDQIIDRLHETIQTMKDGLRAH